MEKKFLYFCITILLISNIFFINLIIFDLQNLSNSDIYLGKILNQSVHLLLVLYILFKIRTITFNKYLLLAIFILFIDIAYDFLPIQIELISYKISSNIFFTLIQRAGWLMIILFLGGSFFAKTNTAKVLTIILFLSFILGHYWGFADLNYLSITYYVFLIILFLMQIASLNSGGKYINMLSISTFLIVVGDLCFLFSGYHNDYMWRYLFVIPRMLVQLGELMIIYQLLEVSKSKVDSSNRY
jgi:hypothetical protein